MQMPQCLGCRHNQMLNKYHTSVSVLVNLLDLRRHMPLRDAPRRRAGSRAGACGSSWGGADRSVCICGFSPGRFFGFFLFLLGLENSCQHLPLDRAKSAVQAYLLPSPNWLKAVEKSHILEQIRKQPESGWNRKDRDAEQNETEDGHGKKQPQ